MGTREYSIDLIKQMAECDANYIRLLKLLPQLRACRNKTLVKEAFFKEQSKLEAKATAKSNMVKADNKCKEENPESFNSNSESEYSPPLGKIAEFYVSDEAHSDQRTIVEIRVLESFKYTTTLEIIQKPEIGEWISNPCMQVRVYHDASTAEVTSYQSHRNFKPKYSQPNPKMYQRDEKMQVNKFLGEWLTHCLKAGRSVIAPDLVFNT